MPPGGRLVFETPPTPSDENCYRLRKASRRSRSLSSIRLGGLLLRRLLNCSRQRVSPAISCLVSSSVMVVHPVMAMSGSVFLLTVFTCLSSDLGHWVGGRGLTRVAGLA